MFVVFVCCCWLVVQCYWLSFYWLCLLVIVKCCLCFILFVFGVLVFVCLLRWLGCVFCLDLLAVFVVVLIRCLVPRLFYGWIIVVWCLSFVVCLWICGCGWYCLICVCCDGLFAYVYIARLLVVWFVFACFCLVVIVICVVWY